MAEQQTRGQILIIDDQEPTRYVFRRILTHAGYEVEEAETGREGLAKAMLSPILIIADVNLPDMLGYDVCRRLKSNPATRNIPVLQISASFISDESKVQALEGGADSYLTQPVEPTVLIASVNALLRMRRAEALSHLSAVQWQSTFDSLSDGLALADAEGMVIRTNTCFTRMLGSPASDAEGQSLATLFETRFGVDFAEYRQQLLSGVLPELSHGKRWYRVRYDVIKPEGDAPSGAVLIVSDITDHKKLEETLKLSERLAATGRLAHIIAHEINNPLEAMSNLLYLAAQDTALAPETQTYIEQAVFELDRISQITKQVLAYHRESKQPMRTPANEVLQGVLAMFRAHVGGLGVELITRLNCTQPIVIHPGEMRQVFGNILSNALDTLQSSQPQRGKLRVRCFAAKDELRGRKGVRFLFSDNGAGIPVASLPHIFGAFYTTKETRGSGVGLWLSAEVIEKHHGRIRLRTRTEGQYRGTLFDVFLPFAE